MRTVCCGMWRVLLFRGKLKRTLLTHCTDQELCRCVLAGGKNHLNGG